MVAGKLSSKYQITIPKEVREPTGLQAGDYLAYEVRGDEIILRRVEPFDAAFHKTLESTVEEWASPEDEEAFGDL